MGDPNDYAAAAQSRTREAERCANASVQQAEAEAASRYWNDPHAAPELTWWERWGGWLLGALIVVVTASTFIKAVVLGSASVGEYLLGWMAAALFLAALGALSQAMR